MPSSLIISGLFRHFGKRPSQFLLGVEHVPQQSVEQFLHGLYVRISILIVLEFAVTGTYPKRIEC
jgi:hypothetical protein